MSTSAGRDTPEPPEQVYTGDGTALTVSDRLGAGAEGAVHRVDDRRVVKLYKPAYRTTDRARKIAAMLTSRPADPLADDESAADTTTYVWPTARVFAPETADPDPDRFVGYLMSRLDLETRREAQRHARRALDWRHSTEHERLQTAYNLAAAVGYIHEQSHAVGDLNHENIYFTTAGLVALIDCDAFHITGADGTVFRGQTEHPRYAPPEGVEGDLDAVRRADHFGLAVHLFQLLMAGFHPFQGAGDHSTGGSLADQIDAHRFPYPRPDRGVTPPPGAPAYRQLPAAVRALFERAFVAGKREPAERPSAVAWMERLKTVLTGPDTDEATDSPATGALSVDVDAELAAVQELLPELSRSDFFDSEAGVGFEFTFPPVDCPVDQFRLMIEYTAAYPAAPPDVWVIEPRITAATDGVAATDRYGNARIEPPAFTWHSETDTGATAVEMAAKWVQAYCQSLGDESPGD